MSRLRRLFLPTFHLFSLFCSKVSLNLAPQAIVFNKFDSNYDNFLIFQAPQAKFLRNYGLFLQKSLNFPCPRKHSERHSANLKISLFWSSPPYFGSEPLKQKKHKTPGISSIHLLGQSALPRLLATSWKRLAT